MARKNLLSSLIEPKLPAGNSPVLDARPDNGGTVSSVVRQGAIGAVSRSIAELKQQVVAAETLKLRLAGGQAVVELDAALLHPAFVNDRLGVGQEDEAALLESIRSNGQQVPILVRPHPDRPGEFQIAYGHRRVRCAKALGVPVRAVVRDLGDADLVVAQGTENSARADLTFIERALFAHRLEQSGFSRDVIMAALAIDKTVLSKLITVPSRLPSDLIEAIGRAPKIGRDRWLELAAAWDNHHSQTITRALIQSASFASAETDQRFELALRRLSARPKVNAPRPRAKSLVDSEGKVLGKVDETPRSLIITLTGKPASGFSEFVASRLPALLKEFQKPE